MRTPTCVALTALFSLSCLISSPTAAGDKPREALFAEIVPPRWDAMRVGMDILADGKPMWTLFVPPPPPRN
jgi:hypothetical protein